ncbi:hypothetical protein L1887_58949 [Cichorium endivia]|nr:hypothetical protein L1887_58949 [Cichorium endivia]
MCKVPFTWNLSPLRPSKFSFEYLLLPPRSAPTAAPPRLTPKVLQRPPRPSYSSGPGTCPDGPGVGRALKRHPFSGLVDSADSLVRVSRRAEWGAHRPVPGARRYIAETARAANHDRRDGISTSLSTARALAAAPIRTAPRGATGSGHDGALTLSGAPFQGTWARSAAEDASPDYNSDSEAVRFSSWADPGSLAVTKGILVHVHGSFCFAGFDNDPSAGSPTETLLRLLLPLNDKVQWNSRDVAGGEPPTSPRS